MTFNRRFEIGHGFTVSDGAFIILASMQNWLDGDLPVRTCDKIVIRKAQLAEINPSPYASLFKRVICARTFKTPKI